MPEDQTAHVVQDLQKALKTLKICARHLFLDKGFAGIAVLAELERQGQSAEIACPILRHNRRQACAVPGEQELSHDLHVSRRRPGRLYGRARGLSRVHHRQAHQTPEAAQRVDDLDFHLDWSTGKRAANTASASESN